jgi:hypothetical protein
MKDIKAEALEKAIERQRELFGKDRNILVHIAKDSCSYKVWREGCAPTAFPFTPDRKPPPKGDVVMVRNHERYEWVPRISMEELNEHGHLKCKNGTMGSDNGPFFWEFWKPLERSYDSEEREKHLKAIDGLKKKIVKLGNSISSYEDKKDKMVHDFQQMLISKDSRISKLSEDNNRIMKENAICYSKIKGPNGLNDTKAELENQKKAIEGLLGMVTELGPVRCRVCPLGNNGRDCIGGCRNELEKYFSLNLEG